MNEIPERILEVVKKVKEKKLKRLTLDSKGLIEIPADIFELTHLEKLFIHHASLTSIPDAISQLQNLTKLDLSGNQLRILPESLGGLQKLTELNLSSNQLRALPESLGRLRKLTILNLSSNQLKTLPESLGQLQNLTKLSLGGNQLKTLPKSLGQLPNLTELVLNGNQLKVLPQNLGQLLNLTELVLSGNQLKALPKSLGQLQTLTKLNLSNNSLAALPEGLGGLGKLTELNLSSNQLIVLPKSLGRLLNLTELDLSGNQLVVLPENLGRLQNLTGLFLWNNQLARLPENLGQVQNLTRLDLSGNKLTVLPENLDRLQKLAELNLSGNQLTTLPENLGRLQSLTRLDLSDNQLKALPKNLGPLQNLTRLDLSSNQLTVLPESLGGLQSLTELNLSNNPLAALPKRLGGLQSLTRLDLSGNQLKAMSEHLSQLQNLTRLDLSGNQLTTLPKSLGGLQNLTHLNLSKNLLTVLPDIIFHLQYLKELDLRSNQLTTLPEALEQMQNLTKLNFRGNAITNLPPEVARRGAKAIKNYFRQLRAEGQDYLYEAKLLIVGEGETGKTSLAKKIQDSGYVLQGEDSTQGIEVTRWEFPIPKDLLGLQDLADPETKFQVNIWDFGGQAIYHATHQFFLTKRSLYLLVADTRKEDTDFYYWLNVVELLSDNSPLLIIKNEKQDRKREINERQLRGQFTNLEKTLATNLATNRGLPDIIREIKHLMCRLPHIGAPLPKTWAKVREALEKDPRNYISQDEYLTICQRYGFTERGDKLQLSEYLHDLGVCLHFQDDPILKRTVILKPRWGTAAVYKVLDNKTIIENRGKFSRADLERIWDEEQYTGMQDELLQLMMNFKLCYQIPGRQNIYIAPQLLAENQPKYEWAENNNLQLRYTYKEFMPKGILTQFIIMVMHGLMSEQKYIWKSGVVLEDDQAKAEVIEFYEKREITIRVVGKHKRDLLIKIDHEFNKIHRSYPRLKYDKLIPCNCAFCEASPEPYFYPFEILRKFAADRRDLIQCHQSYEMVNVGGLIDDVMDRYGNSSRERENEGDQVDYDFMRIRAFLTRGFSEADLRRLCQDEPAFKPLSAQLAQAASLAEVIDKLLDFAERQELMETLLDWAKTQNPAKYKKLNPYVREATQ